MKSITRILSLVGALALTLSSSRADESRSERKARELEDSGRPVAVKGASVIEFTAAYDATFDAIVRSLKLSDNAVVVADRDAGLIATDIVVTGGWKQTGTRTVVTLIKDTPTHTIVKVAVTTQGRYKALQTEPWGDPSLDKAQTAVEAKALQAAIVPAPLK